VGLMSGSARSRSIEDHLKPGDHLCFLYEDKTEQFQVAMPFLVNGLAKGEKCLYLADENTAAEIKAGLLMHGVDVERCLRSGQLTILTAGQSPISPGRFDPRVLVAFLTSAVKKALEAGYSGLRAAGEGTWILRYLNSLDSYLECEAMLNAALRDLPVKALCQYNTRRFLGDLVMKVLRTHPRVLLGLDLYENPYYEQSTPQPRGEESA